MIRALIAWLTPGSESDTADGESPDGNTASEDAEDKSADSTFVRSRLDASVLSSHGGPSGSPIQEIEEDVQELEDQLPDDQPQFDDP
ncbi:MAG: hypothetical protein V5A52_06705 [Halovenus sp.]|uniref:hypothetical protein n=1 Tax=Halovenus amylolytica TaxID=2500550 RepID=UPI000FE3AD62